MIEADDVVKSLTDWREGLTVRGRLTHDYIGMTPTLLYFGFRQVMRFTLQSCGKGVVSIF